MCKIETIKTGNLREFVRDVVNQTVEELESRKPKKTIMYSSKSVMERLQISEGTFRKYVKNGTIKVKRIGRDLRVSEEDLKIAMKEMSNLKSRR